MAQSNFGLGSLRTEKEPATPQFPAALHFFPKLGRKVLTAHQVAAIPKAYGLDPGGNFGPHLHPLGDEYLIHSDFRDVRKGEFNYGNPTAQKEGKKEELPVGPSIAEKPTEKPKIKGLPQLLLFPMGVRMRADHRARAA